MTICFPDLRDALLSAVRSQLRPEGCWLLKMVGGVLPWSGGGDCRDILMDEYNENLTWLYCEFVILIYIYTCLLSKDNKPNSQYIGTISSLMLLLLTISVAFDAVARWLPISKKSGNHLTYRYFIRESARHSPPPSARVHRLPLNSPSFFSIFLKKIRQPHDC